MKLRARHRTILPMSSDVDGGTKTPDGFDIKKFIEENEKKMNEATRKIEEDMASDTDSDSEEEDELRDKR